MGVEGFRDTDETRNFARVCRFGAAVRSCQEVSQEAAAELFAPSEQQALQNQTSSTWDAFRSSLTHKVLGICLLLTFGCFYQMSSGNVEASKDPDVGDLKWITGKQSKGEPQENLCGSHLCIGLSFLNHHLISRESISLLNSSYYLKVVPWFLLSTQKYFCSYCQFK